MNDESKRWKLSVELTKEQEQFLIEMRKQDEFCRLSYGELLRRMISRGMEAQKHGNG